jgi:hypothetical protein
MLDAGCWMLDFILSLIYENNTIWRSR